METQEDKFDMVVEGPNEEEIDFVTLFFDQISGDISEFESSEEYFDTLRRILSPENDRERLMTEFERSSAISGVQASYEEFQVDEGSNYRRGHVKVREKTVLSEQGEGEAWIRYWVDRYESSDPL